jgi:hypothetical protein
MGFMRRVIHHEIVIRWDTVVTDETTADVVPDSTLADTWRKIVEDHLQLGSETPTLQVTATTWVD